MSVQPIHDTILTALGGSVPFGGERYVEEAVKVLTEREYTVSDAIIEQVTENFGVSEAEVKSRLVALGIAVRPEPEPEPVVDDEPVPTEERIASLEQKIDALIAAAEARGLTVHVG